MRKSLSYLAGTLIELLLIFIHKLVDHGHEVKARLVITVKDTASDCCGELIRLTGTLIIFPDGIHDARAIRLDVITLELADNDDELVAREPYYGTF